MLKLQIIQEYILMACDKISATELSFLMGEILLENGAEISRIQDTMERVANFYGVENFNVFVLTNAIMATGIENGEEHSAKLKFTRTSSLHLGRVSAINQLSREICEGKYSISEAYEIAKKSREIPTCKKWLSLLAAAISCAGYCYVFGRQNMLDGVAALICGVVLQLYLFYTSENKMSKFIVNISASALVTLITILLKCAGFPLDLASVVIGSIFPLLPGVALTTSIRDFLNSDYLSGTIRFVDATLIGGCIAIGVGVTFKIYSLLGGVVI